MHGVWHDEHTKAEDDTSSHSFFVYHITTYAVPRRRFSLWRRGVRRARRRHHAPIQAHLSTAGCTPR